MKPEDRTAFSAHYISVWWLVTALSFVFGAAITSVAQIFQWFDDKGAIHFSDFPPATGTPYEARTFPPRSKKTPDPEPTTVPVAATPPEPRPTRGPAHLVLRDQLSVDQRSGGVVFTGRVENQGDETAYDIAVAITVMDTDAGTACLHDRIEVSSSTLLPGESAGYSRVFYSGCFQRAHRTDLRVLWR